MRAYVLSHFSHVQLLATLGTVACQAPLSLGFSRPEYWSGLPRPPPGDLPDQGLNPISYVSCIGRHSAAQIWLDSQHCPRTVCTARCRVQEPRSWGAAFAGVQSQTGLSD